LGGPEAVLDAVEKRIISHALPKIEPRFFGRPVHGRVTVIDFGCPLHQQLRTVLPPKKSQN